MEVVTAIATSRGTTETDIAENYTQRQLLHIAETYVKDKMMVMEMVSRAFAGKSKGKKGAEVSKKGKKWKSLNIRRSARRAGFRRDVNVVDMDEESPDALRMKVAAIMNPRRSGPLLGT